MNYRGDDGLETGSASMTERPSRREAGSGVDTVIACPINDTLYLVLGAGAPMSGLQSVFLNGDPALPAKSPVVSWPLTDPKARGSHGFVALVFTGALKRERLTSLVMRGQGRAVQYRIAPNVLRPDGLAAALVDLAGQSLPSVVDGIIEMLGQGPIGRRKLAAMTAFVQIGAKADGFIEIIGAFDDGDIFLQGWSSEIATGISRVLIAGSTPQIAECTAASFDRHDLNSQGRGLAAIVVAPEPIDPFGLQRVYFRTREGWRYSDVYEQRLLAAPRETPGYARAILPKLRGPADVLARLRGAAYRYEGLDTVSSLTLPVRIAIDHALRIEGGGILIGGWFLDPDRRVEAVRIRRRQASVDLSASWCRVDRPDVSAVFDGKQPFISRLDPDQHNHGFVVFVPEFDPDGSAPVYLEFVIPHAPPAYFPVIPKRVSYRDAVTRQLKAINARAASLPEIVEQHLIPLVASAATKPPRLERTEHVGAEAAKGDTTLVIGLDDQTADVCQLIALLALDPEVKGAPIVVAGPDRAIAGQRSELRRLAGFYGLSIDLVSISDFSDVFDALSVGSGAAPTERLVLFSADFIPSGSGWFGRLRAAHAGHDKPCIISPTLLYEDLSVRWAGYRLETDGSTLTENYVGYPVSALNDVVSTTTAAANLECCTLTKSAMSALAEGGRGYLGNREKGIDLALQLRKAGMTAVWLPDVHVLGAEAPIDGVNSWEVHARRVDRDVFSTRWSETLAGMTGTEA